MRISLTGQTRPVQQLPEPARFWIAYAPRNWRSANGMWTDLANARVSGLHGSHRSLMPELDASELDDLFYLPPVVPELARRRDALAISLIEAEVPVLVQLLPGETTKAVGAYVVFDLLEPLVEGEIERLAVLPRGSTAAWPLISGVTDRIDVWDEACTLLRSAGVRCLQAVTVELSPALRRKLAEDRDDDVFDALFHGEAATEQQLAAYADRFGFEPFMMRPLTGHSPRQIRNRRIAADLALAGEIWLRLGKQPFVGHALFRAARGAEHTHHDLAALVRDNNLTVMDWLDAQSVKVVEEIVKKGRSKLLRRLMETYLGRQGAEPLEPEPPEPDPDLEPDSDL